MVISVCPSQIDWHMLYKNYLILMVIFLKKKISSIVSIDCILLTVIFLFALFINPPHQTQVPVNPENQG